MSRGKIQAVVTTKAPGAIGPYSQAVSTGGMVFVSGQTPLRSDGTLVSGTIAEQTEQCLKNISEILQAGGLTMDAVVKTTVYMVDLAKFLEMNEAYAKGFRAPFPARATVQVTALPKGASIEIDAVAVGP